MSYMGKGETPKLNYALIKRAVCGDEAALEMILQHFDAYINTVSTVEKNYLLWGDHQRSRRGYENSNSDAPRESNPRKME